MLTRRYSLRVRLSILYILTAVVPVLIIGLILPAYYQGVITGETQILTESMLTALTRNIETYTDDLDRLTIAPYSNDEVMRALKLKASGQYAKADAYTRLIADRALSQTLPNYLQNTRKDIVGTVLIPLDGSAFVTAAGQTARVVNSYPFAAQDWYKAAFAADGRGVFISAHTQDYLVTPTVLHVFSVARLIKDPDSQQPLAIIMADADTVVLQTILSNIGFSVSAVICVLDDNRQILFTTTPLSPEMQQTLDGQVPPNAPYVSVAKAIASTRWQIVVLLSNAELAAKVRWLYVAGALLACGGVILTFLLFMGLSRWIVRPFRAMIAVMRRVQQGDLSARYAVRGNDEVMELGQVLNHMIAQVDDLIAREYRAVLRQRNAEYRALQSQIQPHFLYNTLNGFIGLNHLGERKTLEDAIRALSGLLRYTLDSAEYTTLKDEFLFVERYCALQKMRFGERLSVECHYDPRVADVRLPRLLLQPLVENAIIHGIEPLVRPGRLHVYAGIGEDGIHISVSDDGHGFDPAASNAHARIGLMNVRERLTALAPDSHFSIVSAVGEGTRIDITLPLELEIWVGAKEH